MKISREYIKRVGKNNSYVNNTKGGSSGGSGGEGVSSLKQLRDTEIENEADGDVLVYNATDEKWKNQEKAPKAVHADEADEADHALEADHAIKADKVPWTGVQDVITGSPSANEFNICDTTPSNNKMWFNYRGRQGGQLSSAITEYDFGNGRGSRSGVTVRAANFFADSAVSVVSDERKKIVSKEMVLDLDKIADAPSVLFKWRDSNEETEHVGTIAQYWQKVLPQVVCEDQERNLSMQYGTAALVAVISVARELREIKKLLKDHGIQ
jgi:hypothetical protein